MGSHCNRSSIPVALISAYEFFPSDIVRIGAIVCFYTRPYLGHRFLCIDVSYERVDISFLLLALLGCEATNVHKLTQNRCRHKSMKQYSNEAIVFSISWAFSFAIENERNDSRNGNFCSEKHVNVFPSFLNLIRSSKMLSLMKWIVYWHRLSSTFHTLSTLFLVNDNLVLLLYGKHTVVRAPDQRSLFRPRSCKGIAL